MKNGIIRPSTKVWSQLKTDHAINKFISDEFKTVNGEAAKRLNNEIWSVIDDALNVEVEERNHFAKRWSDKAVALSALALVAGNVIGWLIWG